MRAELVSLLTIAERARMQRFVHDADARRFLVGRGHLRRVLGAQLGVAPAAVELVQGPHGKLAVTPDLAFNVSHSGAVVLIAVGRGADLGVDVEQIVAPGHATAARLDIVFSPREIAAHGALPAALRLASFFHVWTSKEAILKAAGTGLALPLQAFDVAVDPREPPALQAARTPVLSERSVTLRAVPVPAGYTAVLAVMSRR